MKCKPIGNRFSLCLSCTPHIGASYIEFCLIISFGTNIGTLHPWTTFFFCDIFQYIKYPQTPQNERFINYLKEKARESVLSLVPHSEALASPYPSKRATPKPTPICNTFKPHLH